MNKISIQFDDFNVSDELILAHNHDNDIGAAVSFLGLVRDLTNENITKMTLEHYPGMTEKSLRKIAEKAQSRWKLGNITIIHRVGELNINEQIVLVITTSKHRKSAFESCEYIMDYLKTQAPFWKKEHTEKGSKWVEAKKIDDIQKERWN
jgi:molybdopterin synthase catalytic subunit